MSHLNLIGLSWRVRTSRPHVIGLFILLAGAMCVAQAFVHAAPVTLTFEATVGPPRQGFDAFVPPGWNISLQEGDTISGKFTFEPFDAGSNVSHTTLVQPFDFSIYIKTQTLTTLQYGIDVFNDIWIETDSIGVDMAGLRDQISLACSAGAHTPSCIPATIAAPNSLTWTIGFFLYGDSSVLDGADISATPSTWRQFNARSILVTLIDNSAHRSYGFQATPTSIDAVPEPENCLPLSFATVLMILSRYRGVESRPFICNGR